MNRRMKRKMFEIFISLAVALGVFIYNRYENNIKRWLLVMTQAETYTSSSIPDYDGKNYIFINNNKPEFSDKDYESKPFERYSKLDILNRAGRAYANISIDLMPKEERSSIGMVKPSGWQTIKYDNVDGKYLYNRCHLIGYQLTGENANEKNLITCTRQMNAKTMLEFENEVANYIKTTKKEVLYRVTPVYRDTNLVATGVQIEAASREDKCKDICFNVFVYNVQDGITIDYSNGNSKLK